LISSVPLAKVGAGGGAGAGVGVGVGVGVVEPELELDPELVVVVEPVDDVEPVEPVEVGVVEPVDDVEPVEPVEVGVVAPVDDVDVVPVDEGARPTGQVWVVPEVPCVVPPVEDVLDGGVVVGGDADVDVGAEVAVDALGAAPEGVVVLGVVAVGVDEVPPTVF
jgi:hypothetical protein